MGGFSGLALGAFCLEGDLFSALLLPWAFQCRFQHGVRGRRLFITSDAGLPGLPGAATGAGMAGGAHMDPPDTFGEQPSRMQEGSRVWGIGCPVVPSACAGQRPFAASARLRREGRELDRGQMGRKEKKIRESTRHLAILPHSLQLADTQSTTPARCYLLRSRYH